MDNLAKDMGCIDVPRMIPYRTKLQREKENLEARLLEVNEAIELMDANPKVVQVLDAIRRTGIC